jgi:hypothetical protein
MYITVINSVPYLQRLQLVSKRCLGKQWQICQNNPGHITTECGKTHVARMGEDRGVYRVLVGKPEGKRSLGRPRRRWEDNIKINLQEVGGGRGDWMELAQDRDRWRALVGTVRNFRVP